MQGVKTFSSHSDWITSIAWSDHSEYHVLTSSHDKTAKLWDTRTAVPLHTLEGHTDKVQLCVVDITSLHSIAILWLRLLVGIRVMQPRVARMCSKISFWQHLVCIAYSFVNSACVHIGA